MLFLLSGPDFESDYLAKTPGVSGPNTYVHDAATRWRLYYQLVEAAAF